MVRVGVRKLPALVVRGMLARSGTKTLGGDSSAEWRGRGSWMYRGLLTGSRPDLSPSPSCLIPPVPMPPGVADGTRPVCGQAPMGNLLREMSPDTAPAIYPVWRYTCSSIIYFPWFALMVAGSK